MVISTELRKALENTSLSFEELRAFESGLALLTSEDQEAFLHIVKENPELVYPLYINFKAKLHASQGGDTEWEEAIEKELEELEIFMERKRVGNEIA